ncbi:MAG TPA: PEP-CTERM sorting domain-containing protein [Candidatus Aquabacterium excrementipullorum]|nr:PEP-CTERM sorting domain-containing protein [Candidatus Aquabacterium excrementipullorum]
MALALSLPSAHAAAIFTDNFDANPLGLNITPTGWSVSSGSVDVIGDGYFDFLPGNGRYLDLDGSTSSAGVLSRSLLLAGNTSYIATFQLAGNHRNGNSDAVNVTFGDAQASYTLVPSAGFTTYSLAFTTGASGNYTLSFDDQGADQMGALLDNVSVAAVPEPGGTALMLGGLATVAIMRRRKQ